MRKVTVRQNRRRKTARRRAPVRRVARASAPARRRRRLAAPARRRAPVRRRLAAPRRRRRAMATKKPAMTELLMYGAVGAGAAYGVEMALDRVGIIQEKIESPTMQAVAKTGVTTALCLGAVGMSRKGKKRTQQLVLAGCTGALSVSLLKLGTTLWQENVTTGGTTGEEGVNAAAFRRAGTVTPLPGVAARARRGVGAAARRGMAAPNPGRVLPGTMQQLNARSTDALLDGNL